MAIDDNELKKQLQSWFIKAFVSQHVTHETTLTITYIMAQLCLTCLTHNNTDLLLKTHKIICLYTDTNILENSAAPIFIKFKQLCTEILAERSVDPELATLMKFREFVTRYEPDKQLKPENKDTFEQSHWFVDPRKYQLKENNTNEKVAITGENLNHVLSIHYLNSKLIEIKMKIKNIIDNNLILPLYAISTLLEPYTTVIEARSFFQALNIDQLNINEPSKLKAELQEFKKNIIDHTYPM